MKTYELIATPEKWTQGTYAKSKYGRPIGPTESNAVCWDIEGAIRKVYKKGEAGEVWFKINKFLNAHFSLIGTTTPSAATPKLSPC